jgi:uroporphyrinogen-III decarboxylase
MEFLSVYDEAFCGWHPVAQSVVRGPSDLVCALPGAEKATLALVEDPEQMETLLQKVTSTLKEFLLLQMTQLPPFQAGYVVGQYDLWAPQSVLRIQEDFSTLYSPRYYRRFLKPCDESLASLTDYTLLHLHTTSLFLIDEFL